MATNCSSISCGDGEVEGLSLWQPGAVKNTRIIIPAFGTVFPAFLSSPFPKPILVSPADSFDIYNKSLVPNALTIIEKVYSRKSNIKFYQFIILVFL
jgi:hypothetical protein